MSDTLDDWLDIASDKVKRNVEIVTPEDIGNNYFLHISTDTGIEKFIPVIGQNQANMEDRTVPRVCVATTILGCIIGLFRAELNFISLKSDGTPKEKKYKGGMIIYAVPFLEALKPNIKMVYDANRTDEHWLVTYNKDTIKYIPEKIGKMFYRSIKYISVSGDKPVSEAEIYFEVTNKEGIAFSKNIFLEKGYWVVIGRMQEGIYGNVDKDSTSWNNDKDHTVKAITANEYNSAKRASADLLSLQDKVPNYLNW